MAKLLLDAGINGNSYIVNHLKMSISFKWLH